MTIINCDSFLWSEAEGSRSLPGSDISGDRLADQEHQVDDNVEALSYIDLCYIL